MSDAPIKLVPTLDAERAVAFKDAAVFLRDFADRMERGDISEAALVFNDRENNCFASWGHFSDRWRMLGAIEYAKSSVLSS